MGALKAIPSEACRIVTTTAYVSCAECGLWWSHNEARPACPQATKRKRKPIDGEKFGDLSRTGHVCATCGILVGTPGDGKPRKCTACRTVGYAPYTPEQIAAMNGPATRKTL